MAALPQPRLTPEKYLEIERAAQFRHEFYDGRMYAMSGGSYWHARIILNFAAALHLALKKGPCAVVTNDLRVRVSPGGLYTYPDIVVTCAEPQFADDQKDTLLNPVILIEALSPSTEAYDRGFKFAQYRLIESLQEYALVSQVEPRVEVFRRQKDSGWLLTEFVSLDAVCHFESAPCTIALADIYEKVAFGTEQPSPPGQ
jgi:Uma2 family endonuclease